MADWQYVEGSRPNQPMFVDLDQFRELFLRSACKSAVDAVDDIHRTAYAEMIAQTTPDPADPQS